MSTLKNILIDIDTRLPNSFTIKSKVSWIDSKLNNIWTHVVPYTENISLKTIADQEEYSLPEGIKLEHIDAVYISQDIVITSATIWDNYVFKKPNEYRSGRCYYNAYGGKIGIKPIPNIADLTIKLIAKNKPSELTVNDQGAAEDVDFDEIMDPDVQDIFVYDCMSIIAENPPYEDAARARYFRQKADEIFELILEKELRYKIKYGNKARPNKWWRR